MLFSIASPSKKTFLRLSSPSLFQLHPLQLQAHKKHLKSNSKETCKKQLPTTYQKNTSNPTPKRHAKNNYLLLTKKTPQIQLQRDMQKTTTYYLPKKHLKSNFLTKNPSLSLQASLHQDHQLRHVPRHSDDPRRAKDAEDPGDAQHRGAPHVRAGPGDEEGLVFFFFLRVI